MQRRIYRVLLGTFVATLLIVAVALFTHHLRESVAYLCIWTILFPALAIWRIRREHTQ
jgi:hypothetical protein